MLDIIDIRRHQVMIQGEFPAQLQTAFRGMERTNNPWGINHDKRMDWAEGLSVKTIDENPQPDVLYWVGCAASYDPQSQRTARAFVQLLDHAGVNFAVLGKKECCTGDSARRSGNELWYQQLAGQNVSTLNQVKPKLIVATCPHCMNTVGKEYRQLGGNFKVMHHTEYLETLVAQGKLHAGAAPATVAYHDPCYLAVTTASTMLRVICSIFSATTWSNLAAIVKTRSAVGPAARSSGEKSPGRRRFQTIAIAKPSTRSRAGKTEFSLSAAPSARACWIALLPGAKQTHRGERCGGVAARKRGEEAGKGRGGRACQSSRATTVSKLSGDSKN